MGEAITIAILALAVFAICLIACSVALAINRPGIRPPLGPIDQDLDMRLMRTEGAYRLCQQQLAQQLGVSKAPSEDP
jgi:hypothetical protein